MHSLTGFFYGSGEKAETSEWPAMVEVKGRVRLSGFGKFIQELPKSRNRALMVYKASFCYHCSSITLSNILLQTTVEVTLLLLIYYIIPNRLTVSSQNSSVFSSWKPESKEITIKHVTCMSYRNGTHVLSREPTLDWVKFCINSSKKFGCQIRCLSVCELLCLCGI